MEINKVYVFNIKTKFTHISKTEIFTKISSLNNIPTLLFQKNNLFYFPAPFGRNKVKKSYCKILKKMNKNIWSSKIPRNLANFRSMHLLLYQITIFQNFRTRCVCLTRDSA